MADKWTKLKGELQGTYRKMRSAITNTVDSVKLKNRIAEQKEIIEDAQFEIGVIITEARRGMTDEMPTGLLLKAEEAERIGKLLKAIAACEAEIEALEAELSIVKQRTAPAQTEAQSETEPETVDVSTAADGPEESTES